MQNDSSSRASDEGSHSAKPGREAASGGRPGKRLGHTLLSRDMWIGQYDYAEQCLPSIPCMRKRRRGATPSGHAPSPSVFIGPGDRVPVAVALVLGVQHALAMVGAIIMIPRLYIGSGSRSLNLDTEAQAHVVAASLFVSGVSSVLRAVRVGLPKGWVFGTGLIFNAGPAIAFVPIIESAMHTFYADGTCTLPAACAVGYGKLLGTFATASLLSFALAFVPPAVFHKICPPMVTGVTVVSVALSLLAVSARMVAGGSGACFLAARILRDASLGGVAVTNSTALPNHLRAFDVCPSSAAPRTHPWGAAPWIGLAAFVLAVVLIVEVFGSPALRTLQTLMGIGAGTVLAAALGYIDGRVIADAPLFTFPLVYRFPLGFYAPALLPSLVSYSIVAVYCISALTPASATARQPTSGESFDQRIQGGLLSEAASSLIATLLMSLPLNPYVENIAVVATTRVAHNAVGIITGVLLMMFGIVGKVGALFSAVPEPVIGGVLVFLFGSILVAGVNILAAIDWSDRSRFIVALALGVGAAVSIEPDTFSLFVPDGETAFTNGLAQGAKILLRTSFSLAAIVATVLNAILPKDLHSTER